MRTKSLVLLLLALGCGLIASIGISQVIERNRAGSGPAIEYEEVVVAAVDLKQGDKLKESSLEIKPLIKGTVPEGAYRSIGEALKNTLKLRTLILKGEPIVAAKFQNKEEDVTCFIPKGMRVLSIQADSTAAAGNLLNPNDRVDVLLHVPGNNQNQGAVVKTILQNIKVFSVNDNTRAVGDQGEQNLEKTTRYVTLLVTPEQSRVLTLAQNQGQIKLSLRGAFDEEITLENDKKDVGQVLAGNSGSDANNSKKEDDALNPLQSAGKSFGTFLETLDAVAKQAKDNQPPVAPASAGTPPALPYETFTQVIIEGPTPRVVQMSRDKKNPKGTWVDDGVKGARPPRVAPSPTVPTTPASTATATTTDSLGLPTQPADVNVKNTTF